MLFFSTSVVFEEKIVKKKQKLKTRIEKYIITVAWVCCVDGIIIICLVLVFVCVFDGGGCKILERREE